MFGHKFTGVETDVLKSVESSSQKVGAGFEICRTLVEHEVETALWTDEKHSAVKAVATCDIEEDLKNLMKTASISTTETLKVEYLRRYIDIVQKCVELLTMGVGWPKSFDLMHEVRKAVELFAVFLRQSISENWSCLESPQFKPRIDDGKVLVKWAWAVCQGSSQHWATHLETASKELKAKCPPSSLIEDSALLTDPSLQKQLFSNPHRHELSGENQALNAKLQCLKVAAGHGFVVSGELKDAYKDALDVKKFSKTVILTDWIIDRVTRDRKTTPEEIKQQANTINEMIMKTNADVPVYLTMLVQKMQKM